MAKKAKKAKKYNLKKAAKEAGFTEEQIASFESKEALQNAVNRIKPTMMASAGKISKPKPPKKKPETEIKTLDLVLKLTPMTAKTPLRAQNEQREIDAFLNRRGIRPAVTRIEIIRDYESLIANKYLTLIKIFYRGTK